MSSRFYFGASSSSSRSSWSDDDNPSSLPFPKPLNRAAFLDPNFDATTFLSTLSQRFQTLEDLQTELRELSQSLNRELVDLVNDNYQDFLALGSTLSGGEERIEDVRLGLLGFQRDVKNLRDQIEIRRGEVTELMKQKKALMVEINAGRTMLEFSERLDELEIKLGLSQRNHTIESSIKGTKENNPSTETWSEDWNEDLINDSDDDNDEDDTVPLAPRLRRTINEFSIIGLLVSKHSPQHPFLVAEQHRIRRIREILLLDIDTAIKAQPDVKVKQKIMQLRESIDE